MRIYSQEKADGLWIWREMARLRKKERKTMNLNNKYNINIEITQERQDIKQDRRNVTKCQNINVKEKRKNTW